MYNPYALVHKTPTKKDYLDTTDFDQSEMLDLVKVSTTVRQFLQKGGELDVLRHKNLAMIFAQYAADTRLSFEVATEQLGGHAANLEPGSVALDERFAIADAGKYISTSADMIMTSGVDHKALLALAENATIPVINGGSNYNRPVQELADIITIFDYLPEGKPLGKVRFVFVGDSSMICASLMMITTKMGMEFVQYAPPAKWLSDEFLKLGRANTQRYGGSVHVSDNPAVLEGADFIYTDAWDRAYDQQVPKDVYMRDFYPKYQVNHELLAATGNPNVKFMHCLPAHRGEEVTDDIIDGPRSIVWAEATNRLVAARGVTLYFSGLAEAALDEIKHQEEK